MRPTLMEAVYPTPPFCPRHVVPLASLPGTHPSSDGRDLGVTQWQQQGEVCGQEGCLWRVPKAGGWVALGMLML